MTGQGLDERSNSVDEIHRTFIWFEMKHLNKSLEVRLVQIPRSQDGHCGM